MPSPYGIAELDLAPLCRALKKCGVGADQIEHTTRRLIRPPLGLGQTAAGDPVKGTGAHHLYELAKQSRTFDPNIAARLLRLHEGHPDPEAKWKTLSRAERKRAKRLWDWTGESHGLSVTPKGRPPAIDPALVLYCIRVLCEATGRPRFEFSRTFTGPMGCALIEALPLAQSFLARRFGVPALGRDSKKRRDLRIHSHLEAIAEIVLATRSTPFGKFCRLWGLGPTSHNVADNPSMFRFAIPYARQSCSQKR
jgi:hypothetical protein